MFVGHFPARPLQPGYGTAYGYTPANPTVVTPPLYRPSGALRPLHGLRGAANPTSFSAPQPQAQAELPAQAAATPPTTVPLRTYVALSREFAERYGLRHFGARDLGCFLSGEVRGTLPPDLRDPLLYELAAAAIDCGDFPGDAVDALMLDLYARSPVADRPQLPMAPIRLFIAALRRNLDEMLRKSLERRAAGTPGWGGPNELHAINTNVDFAQLILDGCLAQASDADRKEAEAMRRTCTQDLAALRREFTRAWLALRPAPADDWSQVATPQHKEPGLTQRFSAAVIGTPEAPPAPPWLAQQHASVRQLLAECGEIAKRLNPLLAAAKAHLRSAEQYQDRASRVSEEAQSSAHSDNAMRERQSARECLAQAREHEVPLGALLAEIETLRDEARGRVYIQMRQPQEPVLREMRGIEAGASQAVRSVSSILLNLVKLRQRVG